MIEVGYTADDHKYVVPPVIEPTTANVIELHPKAPVVPITDEVPLTGIEEAVDRLNREAESDYAALMAEGYREMNGEYCPECRGHGTHNPECHNVSWLCSDCGSQLGKCGVATWHEGRCDACGVVTMVTEPRDFRPEVEGMPQATVESCPECGTVVDIEYGEGLLTVAQRHMDAAQTLVDLASSRLSDKLEDGEDVVKDDAVFDEVKYPDEWPQTTLQERFSLLTSEAIAAVAGPRNDVYGEPRFDMSATAEMMNGYLHKRRLLDADKTLESFDVAALLQMVKLSRLAGQPGHHDSMVDSVGWMGVYQECVR